MRAVTIGRISVFLALGMLLVAAMVRDKDDHDAQPPVATGPHGQRSATATPPGDEAIDQRDRPTSRKPEDDASDREDDPYSALREAMVRQQLLGRDIRDQRVLDALRRVPRHQFVPARRRDEAYRDQPLPIGNGQTISQPYIVALMTQLVSPQPDARVLDVGTGSGYQAAVLAELVDQVYSIEIICELADAARSRLEEHGYGKVTVRCGDGYRGWPEHAPFDAIIVAAAPDHVPQPLIDQLAPGGRLVIPVGSNYQELILIEKNQQGSVDRRSIAPVRFVPMTRRPVD